MITRRPETDRFEVLADRWERATAFFSNSSLAAQHPAYQEIIGMGQHAVPLILTRMQSSGGHWFQALHEITGADPVDPKYRGDVAAMQKAWLNWGKSNGSL